MKLYDLCLHPKVLKTLSAYSTNPTGNLVILGSRGVGKESIALAIANEICHRPEHIQITRPEKGAIGIEQIRSIKQYVKLKNLSSGDVRCIAIVGADKMTIEAQNAFLKLLEEPPVSTFILLTSDSNHALLPTIQSRVSSVFVSLPSRELLEEYYIKGGYQADQVRDAVKASVGLPGLCSSILKGDADDYAKDLEFAKDYLRAKLPEKLKMIDKVSKNREQSVVFIDTLRVVAEATLASAPSSPRKWIDMTRLLLSCSNSLRANANTKLALTSLSLELG